MTGRYLAALALITSMTLTISGCEDFQNSTEKAAEKTGQMIEQAGEKTGEVMEKAGEVARQQASKAREKLEEHSQSMQSLDEEIESASTDRKRLQEDIPVAAIATLHPTAGNEAHGTVKFIANKDGGLRVQTFMRGLPPGKHGYHLHLYGDCSAPDGTAAGTHFNLKGSSLNPPADVARITGNLGDIIADQNGNGEHSAVIDQASLEGPKSIIGRSVIIHAKANDPAQPPIGAAGARLACGVVGIAAQTPQG